MKAKKIPLRTCVVTGLKCEKKDLFRIVKTPNDEVVIDKTVNLKENGRGAYLKKDKEVIEKARNTKALNRHLEIEVSDNIYDELENLL